MSDTLQRDQVCALAKTSPTKALDKARGIKGPWFRAQALSWVARFTDSNPVGIAALAAKAAAACDDEYERSAVRAWEVAALAERGERAVAKRSLAEALRSARRIQPASSRSEALLLLMQAAFKIDASEARSVHKTLTDLCPASEHWRCKRAIRDADEMIAGKSEAREFFR